MREQEHGGSRATGARAEYSPLAGEWADAHLDALADAEHRARQAAHRSGKAWTLHADQQTQAILAECPEREASAATLAAYGRDYDRLRARGQTPLQAATTRAHWDRLRTACRVCMEHDIRAWRAASERARKRGDLESAQRRTERAFRLAVVMDSMFMQPDRRTWAHKVAQLQAAGIKPPRKSKRSTPAPSPDVAAVVLLSGKRRGMRVAERHGERLAVLSLFGMRPAELMKGVILRTTGRGPGQHLTAEIAGAKVGKTRGQEALVIRIPVEGAAATALAAEVAGRGGRWTMTTSTADYRSLNRALKSGASVSCYTFRHQLGSECKAAIAAGAMTAEEAAKIMGHRSTASLGAYGSRAKSRGGRRLQANATNKARARPVSYAERAEGRAKAKAKAVGRVRSAPTMPAKPQVGPSMHAPARQAARRPKGPRL